MGTKKKNRIIEHKINVSNENQYTSKTNRNFENKLRKKDAKGWKRMSDELDSQMWKDTGNVHTSAEGNDG